ncbi:deoxyribonuclease IV [bacterium]|nr:deoxyribonuclease IV [bacterium]
MSIAGGVDKAPARGATVRCSAMQIFVKNNNRWEGPPISDEQAGSFQRELEKAGIGIDAVFAHTCYLINLASTREEVVEKSIRALEDELRRCQQLELPGLVMHPGAHLGAGREAGIEQIAGHLRDIFSRIPHVKTRLLLETTVGSGTNLGGTFEDLGDLLAAIDLPDNMGICLDTCHVFAAGYEIRDEASYKKTMAEFDRIVGIKNLKALHLNDSLKPFGSRRDRHAHIGQGEIGLDAFGFLLNDPRLRGIPMALETDKQPDLEDDRKNLNRLRKLIGAPEQRKIAKPASK